MQSKIFASCFSSTKVQVQYYWLGVIQPIRMNDSRHVYFLKLHDLFGYVLSEQTRLNLSSLISEKSKIILVSQTQLIQCKQNFLPMSYWGNKNRLKDPKAVGHFQHLMAILNSATSYKCK